MRERIQLVARNSSVFETHVGTSLARSHAARQGPGERNQLGLAYLQPLVDPRARIGDITPKVSESGVLFVRRLHAS